MYSISQRKTKLFFCKNLKISGNLEIIKKYLSSEYERIMKKAKSIQNQLKYQLKNRKCSRVFCKKIFDTKSSQKELWIGVFHFKRTFRGLSKHILGRLRTFSAGIYLPKVNNRSTRWRCQICSKLTIKITQQAQVFLLLPLNM